MVYHAVQHSQIVFRTLFAKDSKLIHDNHAWDHAGKIDPKDKEDAGLTGEKAQALGLEFANRFFPGHQALVCTHMDGHNGSGNIHVHIVINSLRKLDVEPQDFMERPCDSRAGYKHHQTRNYLTAMQAGIMEISKREGLNQVDLLNPAPIKISEREYWLNRREQEKLDELNARIVADGMKPRTTTYQTQKQFLRDTLRRAVPEPEGGTRPICQIQK